MAYDYRKWECHHCGYEITEVMDDDGSSCSCPGCETTMDKTREVLSGPSL